MEGFGLFLANKCARKACYMRVFAFRPDPNLATAVNIRVRKFVPYSREGERDRSKSRARLVTLYVGKEKERSERMRVSARTPEYECSLTYVFTRAQLAQSPSRSASTLWRCWHARCFRPLCRDLCFRERSMALAPEISTYSISLRAQGLAVAQNVLYGFYTSKRELCGTVGPSDDE